MLVLGFLTAIVACDQGGSSDRPQRSPEQAAETEALIAAARTFGPTEDAGRLRTLQAALEAPLPEDAGPCQIKEPVVATMNALPTDKSLAELEKLSPNCAAFAPSR